MNRIKIPFELKKMNDLFSSHGFEAYLVGGAVRDLIRGKPASDWDVATNASPKDVIAIFHKVIPTGIAHGTVTVHLLGHEIEVTTYRIDSSYSDGRHPDKVSYNATINEDLSRRDFTMNAIAASLEDGHILDPFHGQNDIKRKTIQTVGNSFDRFQEDGLRPIRAIRFASQLNFSIQKDTFSAIFNKEIQKTVAGISIERFRDEFIKILKSDKPSIGIKLLEETKILSLFIPEFKICRNCIQKDYREFHEFDVMDHLLYSCDGAPQNILEIRTAALFHDIGKPLAKKITLTPEGEQYTFYNHEQISAKITKKILTHLRFPNNFINNVVLLVNEHMFHYESCWSDAAVRRFLARVGIENVDYLFKLRLADIYGMHNTSVRLHDTFTGQQLCEFKDRIEKIVHQNTALGIKDLAVNGRDLMESGIPSGKQLGKILKQLLETVLDDPEQNTKGQLLIIAKNLYSHF